MREIEEILGPARSYIAAVEVGRAVVDGVAPGVGGLESQTVVEPTGESTLQTMVGGPTRRDECGDGTPETDIHVIRRFKVSRLQGLQIGQSIRQPIEGGLRWSCCVGG